MNYLREMNAFFDWLETNPLEASTQTLWFHLMAVANKSGWPEWFAVANLLLQAKVGFSENTLTKHRNYLVQKGRIEYKNSGKQQAGKYRLIPFTSINEVNHEVKAEVKGEVDHEVKGSALFKQNETKKDGGGEREIVDLNFAKAIRAIDAQFPSRISPIQSKSLSDYITKGMNPSIVIRAVELTRKAGKDIRYLWGILQNCDGRGIYTLEAFESGQTRRQAQRTGGSSQTERAAFFAQKARETEREEG
ncbi:hypothetical protein ACFPYJ_00610 [Paenibacillus solisilvae]|uniref:DnaB/C C-terminal domain-containing protein n=1 Tax=Paenibacillus solisilvae TaxID=2486751 RepID=A0ABW0VS73_9BACL